MTEAPALDGVKVYDASQGVAGPYCGLLLALAGAEVTKVEPPEGDWLRHLGRRVGDHGPHSWYLNRGKQGRTIDTRTAEGRRQAFELASGADVFLASFRPGVVEKMGLSYEALSRERPTLVYCLVSGFGQTGPLAQRPAVDGVLQAFGGWMHLNRGAAGEPRAFPYFPIDMLAGMHAFQAVQSALIRRWRFGQGGRVDISLMQSAASFLGPRIMEHVGAAGDPQALFSSPNGAFRVQDGWFMVAVTTQAQFVMVCRALGCPGLADDPRFASRDLRVEHRTLLDELVAAQLLRADGATWSRAFEEAGAMGSPVLDFSELLGQAQLRAIGAVGTTVTPSGPMPLVDPPGFARSGALAPPPRLGPAA